MTCSPYKLALARAYAAFEMRPGSAATLGAGEVARVFEEGGARRGVVGAVVAAQRERLIDEHQVRAVHDAEMVGAGVGLAVHGQLEAVDAGLLDDLGVAGEEGPAGEIG